MGDGWGVLAMWYLGRETVLIPLIHQLFDVWANLGVKVDTFALFKGAAAAEDSKTNVGPEGVHWMLIVLARRRGRQG